ncbi:hypothetical protein RF11_04157 [Thelohanellus kitauei]|uniref:Uncharacterized protein n=1 Tax=Thelohanellus kitauei TaxID=669202 RepID=A0A0C2J876_THEKT|nr:hypothetical protein RF11_04157 [Thelohanellus kitauei]
MIVDMRIKKVYFVSDDQTIYDSDKILSKLSVIEKSFIYNISVTTPFSHRFFDKPTRINKIGPSFETLMYLEYLLAGHDIGSIGKQVFDDKNYNMILKVRYDLLHDEPLS